MSTLLTLHDPRGYPPKVTAKRLAPRLETLEGKLIHLVDCLFDNSEVFMKQLAAWFAEHMPRVRTEIVKPRQSWATTRRCAHASSPRPMLPSLP